MYRLPFQLAGIKSEHDPRHFVVCVIHIEVVLPAIETYRRDCKTYTKRGGQGFDTVTERPYTRQNTLPADIRPMRILAAYLDSNEPDEAVKATDTLFWSQFHVNAALRPSI